MHSDNDNASVPSVSVAPVVLVMPIEVFDDQFEVEAETPLKQRYYALCVRCKRCCVDPWSERVIVPIPMLDLTTGDYTKFKVADVQFIAGTERPFDHAGSTREAAAEYVDELPVRCPGSLLVMAEFSP